MATKGKAFCKAQRTVQGFAAILKSAACEWLLIFLMLIDALLSYFLTKFAHICDLQTPCILCSRLDHLLGKEKHNNYRNLLCTNHRLEISSLVSCYKHNKLVDGNEMCDACLCSFATTKNKPKSNSKMQRLMVGKLGPDTGGNGAHGMLLDRDSIPHSIKTRPCSCCSKPWKTRPHAQGLLQLKSSVNVSPKSNILYPRRLHSRDSLKKMRDKIFGSVTIQHPGKTGFNLLSHVGYNELRITSDSELEVLISEEDDDRSLICEKSELKEDSVLRSITQIPLKPHCNNCDQVKPSINFVHSRPSPLESYVQVDVQKPHDVKSLACDASFHGLSELNRLPNPTANPSTWAELISLDDASSPETNALGLPRANSMEKSELTDSLNHESTLSSSPEVITLHHDPQVVGKLSTSEETGTNNMGVASPNKLEDRSTLINTEVEECPKIDKVVNESSSGKANGDTNHSSDSESSESDKEHKVNFATRQPLVSSCGTTNDDSDHSSDSESSKSDKEHEVRQPLKSSSGNTNDDSDHSSDSETSESDKEHEVNATRQPSEKEIDIVTNDMKHSPLISTTVEECSKSNEMVYESAIKNTIDDSDHNNDSKSSESDKEHDVNFTTRQLSEKETDIVTNDMKHSPLISTTVEERSKSNEVVHESAIRNTNDDMDLSSVIEPSESDKEQEVFNFTTDQPLEKDIDLVINDRNSTTIEECHKTNDVAYESAIKDTNDDLSHNIVSESFESEKEHEIFNFAIGQPSEREIDLVNNDLKQSSLISTTIEEFPKTNEVADESAIKNTKDDMGHNNVSTTIEDYPTTDEVVFESAVMNTNDDKGYSSVRESSESDEQQKVFNFATGQPLKTELDTVTNDMEKFPLQDNPAGSELVNQSSSNDEGHNFSLSYDDLQEESASDFNIIRAFDRSFSMESDVESQDGSNVSEIEGENIVDRLKRQVEYDKKCINSLYRELEIERSAADVAASQAMAMITRLQEEKAAMHMEALHYLRMLEEQAEYDVEALEKANEVLNEKERDIQDLEAELEYYRSNFLVDTIAETDHEDGTTEENITAENDVVEHNELYYSFKSTTVGASKGSYRSFNNQTSSLEFEDEKIYIQLCLKNLEDKINKIFTNGLLARVPNSIDIEELVNPEQKGEEESIDAERPQINNEENGPSMHINKNTCNGTVTREEELVDPDNNRRPGSEENSPDMKGKISRGNKREEVDFLALEYKISDLTGKLEALQADYHFLEHSLNSLGYGEEGLQFAQNIFHQLKELCKLGIRLDRQPGS